MASFNKIDNFVNDLGLKVHNLSSDTIKVYLTNELPAATDTIYQASGDAGTNGPKDLATAGGYVAGGATVGTTAWANVSGTSSFTGANVVFTATTGFGPFQYVVIYNSTDATKRLIGWYNYGSAVTLLASETFTVDFTTNTTIFTVA